MAFKSTSEENRPYMRMGTAGMNGGWGVINKTRTCVLHV